MGNRHSSSLAKYRKLRLVASENADTNSVYWDRVDESLMFLVEARLNNIEKVELLVNALETKGGQCVLKSRKPDLPDDGHSHVISARVFRFPWLDGPRQLVSAQVCPNGFDASETGHFCINPYHYEIDRSRVIKIAVEKGRFQWQDVAEDLNPRATPPVPNYKVAHHRDGPLLRTTIAATPLVNDTTAEKEVTIGPPQGITYDQAQISYVELGETLPWMTLCYFEGASGPLATYTVNSDQFEIETGIGSERASTDRLVVDLTPDSAMQDLWKDKAREKIGDGIKMHYIDGCIYVENRSPNPIHIQSAFVNNQLGKEQPAVVKVRAGKYVLKLWDNREFANILSIASFNSFEEVKALEKWANIRISFAQGWGADYEGGSRITQVQASYVTISLPRITELVDKTLDAMGRP